MKKGLKLLAVGFASMMCTMALAACGDNGGTTPDPDTPTKKDYGTINIGLQGNMGSSAGFVGINEGYFKDEGLTTNHTITTGPNIITGLKAGTLDVGMLGNGVSWNYFVNEPSIKLIALDNLTDDDRLIASPNGKGKGLTITSSTEDLYKALAGSKVALDLSTTPGSFFKSLVTKLNTGKDASKQLWFQDVDAVYPNVTGLAADYKVNVISTANGNITAAMTGADAPDFCVAFAPISTKLEKTTGFVTVAKTSTHLADKLTPSTWAVSTEYLKNHADGLQAFMNGLMRSMDLRHDDIDKAVYDTAKITRQEQSDLPGGIAYWPSSKDLNDWFATTAGDGYTYVKQIYESQKGKDGVVTNPDYTSICQVSYLLQAYKNIQAA